MTRTQRALVSIIVLAIAFGISLLAGTNAPPQARTADVPSVRSPSPTPTATVPSRNARFDYYLIALSWSPTWCETNPDDAEQCGRRGYGFVLHGLWPQFERGSGPQDCARVSDPDRSTIADAMAFMPSRRLIEHEWRAHRSCSGLDAKTYFDLADRAFAAVHVPTELDARAPPPRMSAEQLGTAFTRANPGLRTDMFGVICRGADLAEIRICVDTDLQFRSCGRDVRTRCPRNVALRIPSAR